MEKRETTKKFIIENHSRLDDFSMMGRIMEVINNGLVSNDGKEYCYVTRFKGKCVVEMRKTNYGYKVVVQDDIPESLEKEISSATVEYLKYCEKCFEQWDEQSGGKVTEFINDMGERFYRELSKLKEKQNE